MLDEPRRSHWIGVSLIFATISLVSPCWAQNSGTQQPPAGDKQINVNWLYGSFVPKDVPLEPLNGHQRFKLYIRQTYITPGIYIKTVAFAIHGQIRNSPPEWDGGFEGFAKRALSYQGQFIIQNTVSSAGNAVLKWEPRYDRCRCDHFWPRTQHAIVRNFVTYDETEKSLRPQIMPYAGAAAGAAVAAVAWQPGNPSPGIRAYQAAITQVFVGAGINWLAEFAPELFGWMHKNKKAAAQAGSK